MKRVFPNEDPNPQEYNDMKVGDVICTYTSGFYILNSIKRRFCTEDYFNRFYKNKPDTDPNKLFIGDEYGPLFNYSKINLKTGKVGQQIRQCDASYCRPGIKEIENQIKELIKNRRLLKTFSK